MRQAIFTVGSSRSAGNARLVLDTVLGSRRVEIIDLLQWDLTAYDCTYGNSTENFFALTSWLP